jgi:two-component system OmpR family response regulator
MSNPATILLVDDEEAVQKLLAYPLERDGYRVVQARDGDEALRQFEEHSVDLVVLDLMLPKLDGLEVCKRLRAVSHVPIIMLTARDDEVDKVLGLELGADDYVTKPFSLEELTLRIRALLRRTRHDSADDGRLRYLDLELDEERHQVWRGKEEINLSPTEFRLLRYLLLNAELVLSKQQILDHVWQYDFNGEDNVVETYVSYLRRKLEDPDPRLLRTVRGFGYVLRADDAA